MCMGCEPVDLLERVRDTYKYRLLPMACSAPERERAIVEPTAGAETMAACVEGHDGCDEHVERAGPTE